MAPIVGACERAFVPPKPPLRLAETYKLDGDSFIAPVVGFIIARTCFTVRPRSCLSCELPQFLRCAQNCGAVALWEVCQTPVKFRKNFNS